MADDDIYGSRQKYEQFKAHLEELLRPADPLDQRKKYHCKNPVNLQYFRRLFVHFEAHDLSYIRRVRLVQSMRLICYQTSKNLADCTRDDINEIVAAMHSIYHTPKSKQTFICDIKYFWKTLLPEKDPQGRPDETLVPYTVRHLSSKIDRSRQKLRGDKLSWGEFERLVDYFSADPRLQAYLTMSLESLARPQELLLRRIGNVEAHDNFARVYVTEHGKEGPGLLQCIDSYPYLLKWLNVHPQKNNPEAFLFINTGNTGRLKPLRPENVNKFLRRACVDLGIRKPVTCYSLKRNGVTIRRLRGESDMEIQHAARWTSTKQLRTYDLSTQDEAFRRELEKRGIVPPSITTEFVPKKCGFCNILAGFGETLCQQCQRPLDRKEIAEETQRRDDETQCLRTELSVLKAQMSAIRKELLAELRDEIIATRSPRTPMTAAGSRTANGIKISQAVPIRRRRSVGTASASVMINTASSPL